MCYIIVDFKDLCYIIVDFKDLCVTLLWILSIHVLRCCVL